MKEDRTWCRELCVDTSFFFSMSHCVGLEDPELTSEANQGYAIHVIRTTIICIFIYNVFLWVEPMSTLPQSTVSAAYISIVLYKFENMLHACISDAIETGGGSLGAAKMEL